MPHYLRPGIFIEEVFAGDAPRVQSRARTDPAKAVALLEAWSAPRSAVFIGLAAGGPIEEPTLVTNWDLFAFAFHESADERTVLGLSVQAFFAAGGERCWVVRVGAPSEPDALLAASSASLELFDGVSDIAALAMPDASVLHHAGVLDREGLLAIQQGLINTCEYRREGVAVLDAPRAVSARGLVDWRTEAARFDSAWAVMAHPWLLIAPSAGGDLVEVPPSGAVAALRLRADRSIGLLPGLEPVSVVGQAEVVLLRAVGITPIVPTLDGGGRVDDDLRLSLSPHRERAGGRLVTSVFRAVEEGTSWAIFRTSDPALWEQLELEIASFLDVLWRRGHLLGDSADAAYDVRCDESTNTPEGIDSNRVVTSVAFRSDTGAWHHLRIIHQLQ